MVPHQNPIPITQRLEEYFRRLRDAPPASSADEGLTLVCNLLDKVEDELSGIPKKDPSPAPDMPDGRMYPPLADYVKRCSDGSLIARSRAHNIKIEADGSITILNRKSGKIEMMKPGVEA